MKLRYYLFLFAMGMTMKASAQLVINEVMQSNVDCVMDGLNQYPDSWVELWNSGTGSIQLNEYSISDTLDASTAYPLTTQTLASGSHILVCCDKEACGLHTPFRLESGKGCRVYLLRNGVVSDSLYIEKKQPAPNIAYGRETDGSASWGYMLTPTPSKSNSGGIVDNKHILGEPIFSIEGRVFESGQSTPLTLTIPEGSPEGTVIRYTINGTEPTLSNSTLYTNALTIGTTRIIRAKLFCSGWLSPRSTTHSYIFLNRTQTLPVVSIVTDERHLTNSKTGILVEGTYTSNKKNYEYDWRRPINFEYFVEPNTEAELNQVCETRVSGAASRGCALKSLTLYAHKRFGEKHFKYEFFADQRPEITKFKSLVLRNAGNDFDYLYMRDAMAQRVMARTQDMDWQAWQPTIVYINGSYKGILNLRERGNDDNIYSNYNGLEDIDVYENGDLKQGTSDRMTAFRSFYNETGHTIEDFSQWMDCEEYMNYTAMQMYFNNIDYPGNNQMVWRPRTDDGRWRWIAKDVDYTMNLYSQCPASFDYVNWLYNHNPNAPTDWANTSDATRLYRRLMADPTFCQQFCDRMAIFMDDFLNYSSIWKEVWQPMYERIRTEYPTHRKLFNQWWPNYSDEMKIARTFLQQRNAQLFQHLKKQYNLGAIFSLQVNTSIPASDREQILLSANGVKVSHASLNGSFWAGRRLTLSASPVENRNVKAWDVILYDASGRTTKTYEGPTMCMDIPSSCTYLIINAQLGEVDGIDETECTAPAAAHKSMRHGRIVIERGNNLYTLEGNRIE